MHPGVGSNPMSNQVGVDHITGYACRSLSKTELKYLTHKLEFLTLKWAITEQFHEYLCGNNYVIYIDSNPFTYILTSAKLDATGHHWVASLENYNFALNYQS